MKQYGVLKETDPTHLESWVGDAFMEIVTG